MIYQVSTLKRLSRLGVLATVLICCIVLAGWLLEIPALASLVPGWPRMAPIVLFCFLLCSAGVFELTQSRKNIYSALMRIAAAIIVLAIGTFTFGRFLLSLGGPAGIAATPGFGSAISPRFGSPSVASALNFLLAATAFLLPSSDRWGKFYGVLMAAGLAITSIDFVGYTYGIAALSRSPTISTMSLPTTISFILIFTSALLAKPRSGWTAVFFARNSGGATARRFFPAVLILPFVVNGLVVLTYRYSIFEAQFGFAILAVIMSVGLGIVTIVIAGWLARDEEEWRRNNELLEAIIENSGAVVYVKDLAGHYLLVNRKYLDVFGINREVVIGKTDYDLFSKHNADVFRTMDEQVLNANKPLTGEEMAPHVDGPHTYISVKAPLRDNAGNPYAIFGISTDITERKRSEEALAASEERTRSIVDTALDAVISIDSSGTIIDWNPQAERIFGWTAREVIGLPIEETIMPLSQRDTHIKGLNRYLDTGEARVLNKRIELKALNRSGREFPIELSITPIQSGESVRFTAFLRDITDRKNAEIRNQMQLERLALLERITRAVNQRQDMQSIFQVVVRNLEDRLPADFVCICSYDKIKSQITVNHVGANSAPLGYRLGVTERVVIPVDENGLSRCVKGALVYEPDIAEVDFPFPRLLAGQGLRSLVMAPLLTEKGVLGILAVSRLKENAFSSTDCEFLKQLGEHVALAAHQMQLRSSLEEAYEDLKQSQQSILQQERLRALGQMASGIAHDINNAISPVAVYTQSLLEREPDLSSRTRNYLETVGRVVKDVSATVSRMRDFYRRSDSDTEFEPVNLNDLIPQVVELTRARWSDMPQQRGVVIRVLTQLEADLPMVMGSAAEIREAATNLIFNAVDAMPQGGTIAIKTSFVPDPSKQGERHSILLEFGDSGIGMDEDTRRRCLEPFFTTKGERGTGLGLAMVYGAAQRHKASLDIDSAPGNGTRIQLRFTAMPVKTEPSQAVQSLELPPLRLLLVDDDPAVLNSTQIVLELDGHAVVAADGGGAGIEALIAAKDSNQPFDVMVTDLGMPYVDGNQVARTAKELFPSMPVILLTGWGRKMGETDKEPNHVDYTLPKPVDLDELRSTFTHALKISD